MKLKILCLGFLWIVSAVSLQVEISAPSAILINAETGTILYEKNAHTPCFPASTTKIATALYLLEEKSLSLDQTVQASAEALRKKAPNSVAPYLLANDGTFMGLIKGEILSVESLLHGLLLASANDAANVLAEAASSSIPQFVSELNDYLARIGCLKTHFRNPHGYHDPEHVSTAFDLALIMQRALRFPEFSEIIAKSGHIIPASNKRPAFPIKQFNLLLSPGKHYYPKAIGGKTGFHSLAGWCLVSAATHEGRTLIAVLLGCPQNATRFNDSRALFEAAFKEKPLSRLLVPIHAIYPKAVSGAKSELLASLTKDLMISFYPSEKQEFRAFIHWNLPTLPIAKGQKVGEIQVLDQRGVLISASDLVAKKEVLPTFFFSLKERWKKLVN